MRNKHSNFKQRDGDILNWCAWMYRELMRLRSVVAVFGIGLLCGTEAHAQVNVTQEHNNPSRDGVYTDAAFTPSASANLTRDLNFNGSISGNVYAQPLYIEGGPNGPMIIAVTESNNVYALDATTGLPIWSAHRYWSARHIRSSLRQY